MPDSDPGPPLSEPSQGLPFEVQIRRGYRAIAAEDTPRELDSALSPPLSPRAERRARLRFAFRVVAVLSLGLLGLFWLLSLPPQGALARVNGEYITMVQVDREILIDRVFSELTNNGQDVNDTRTTILQRLINQRVLAQAAIRGGMTISDADLDAQITRLPDQQQWTLAQLDTALARQGLSRADLRASIRDVALVNRYIDNVLNRGATDQSQLFTRQNSWSTDAVRAAKIDRFGDPDGAQAPRAGAPAPNFTLADLAGKQVSLQAFRGRPVLLNFWAPWCQPCRVEMPILAARYKHAQELNPQQGLTILAVAINSAPTTVAAFSKELALPFPVLLDANATVLNLYRIGPIPTSFLVDRQGVVRWVQVGTWSDTLLSDKLQLVP